MFSHLVLVLQIVRAILKNEIEKVRVWVSVKFGIIYQNESFLNIHDRDNIIIKS